MTLAFTQFSAANINSFKGRTDIMLRSENEYIRFRRLFEQNVTEGSVEGKYLTGKKKAGLVKVEKFRIRVDKKGGIFQAPTGSTLPPDPAANSSCLIA